MIKVMEIKAINDLKKEKVRKILQEKVGIVKEENAILTIYENLMQIVWQRLLPTLGKFTVTTILKRSIEMSESKYPILTLIEIKDDLEFENLRFQLKEEEHPNISDAFNDLIVNLIEILASLTGEVIIQKLLEEMKK